MIKVASWALALLQALAIAACQAQTASNAATSGQEADSHFFEERIRPLLHEHCLECHSAEQNVEEGGLALDSSQGWQRGGGRGPAITPNEPTSSLLIQAVAHSQPELQMPPGSRLQDSEIEDLKHWIATGAFDPRNVAQRIAALTQEEAEKWWAIAPIPEQSQLALARGLLMKNAKVKSSTSAIDDYVMAALSSIDATPVVRADARTLIRRASYDLTGLPPSMQEVAKFEKDSSEVAFSKLIDQLLFSPHYGERWGRHWLDLMRYLGLRTLSRPQVRPYYHRGLLRTSWELLFQSNSA